MLLDIKHEIPIRGLLLIIKSKKAGWGNVACGQVFKRLWSSLWFNFHHRSPGVTQNYAGSSAEAFSGKFNKGIRSRCTFAFVRGGKLNRTDSGPRSKSRYPSDCGWNCRLMFFCNGWLLPLMSAAAVSPHLTGSNQWKPFLQLLFQILSLMYSQSFLTSTLPK